MGAGCGFSALAVLFFQQNDQGLTMSIFRSVMTRINKFCEAAVQGHAAKPSEWHYESKSKKMRRRVHGKWQYRNPTDSERDEAERELMDRTW
jgi:hypothetical protein